MYFLLAAVERNLKNILMVEINLPIQPLKTKLPIVIDTIGSFILSGYQTTSATTKVLPPKYTKSSVCAFFNAAFKALTTDG